MLADPAMAPDGALLQEYARSKNADAFAELARRHAGLVYGTCWRVLGNEEDAQDVAQECFLELARKAGAVHSSLPAWLHKLARSRSVDAIRRAAARRRAEERAAREAGEESDPTWSEITPYVDEALESLPEHYRAPIILHYLEGHTQAQVSAELGVHQSTVSRQIDSGISQLREHLKQAGIIVSVAALTVLLSEHAATAAPASLSTALGTMAISGVGGSSAAPAYYIGGLVVKKVWLHAAVAAIVLATAGAIAVPRLAATGSASGPSASAGLRSVSSAAKKIQLKAQIFRISGALAQQLGMTQAQRTEVRPQNPAAAAASILATLQTSKSATLICSPTIVTLDDQVATISVTANGETDMNVTSLTVKPHIPSDGKISLDTEFSLDSGGARAVVNGIAKVADGETAIIPSAIRGSSDYLVVAVTPHVIE